MTAQERAGVALHTDAAREIAFPSAVPEEDEADHGDGPQMNTRFSNALVCFDGPVTYGTAYEKVLAHHQKKEQAAKEQAAKDEEKKRKDEEQIAKLEEEGRALKARMADPADALNSPTDLTVAQLKAFLTYHKIAWKSSMNKGDLQALAREHNL